jgi:eukaryotic-like serine/threonine-protein kinase
MTPGKRWQDIEALYHAVVDRTPAERARLMENVDPELRREVESILAQPSANGALDRPAFDFPPDGPTRNDASGNLRIGSSLGPYRIEAEIGAGGMGRVYKARDTRVGRDVAIKQSHEQFTSRFQREASAIAALNHPNVCTLYDVGPDYLVMEYIEGGSPKGPVPLDRALAIAGQIAAALDAAHEKGIVHRDLKPANIKVRPDGSVKVLDFGLAKVAGEAQLTSDSPTVLSASGMILGTAAYMAPEQARGENVDRRADIWAFGVVLYEMLTGSRLFDGPTASDCIADILRKEPDLAKVPARVRRLLRLCLEKDPQKRLRSLGDWQHLIEPEEPRRQSSDVTGLRKIAWFAVPAILVAAAAGIWSAWSRPSGPQRPARFQVNLPDETYFDRSVSVSPDGQNLVFSATGEKDGLWIHNLDTLEWRKLPGTEHGKYPFWSPDSRYLGFLVFSNDGSEVKKIDISGGFAATFYTARGHQLGEGAWSRNGDLIIGGPTGEPIRRISANGGAEVVLTALDGGETSHGKPQFLPDGKHFVYFVAGSAERKGMYSGSVDDAAALPRGRIVTVSARYASGKLLFVRGGALMAQTFDAERRQLTGEPTPIADHVQIINEQPILSASAGVLAYRAGTDSPGNVFTWYDRHGKVIGTIGQPGRDLDPRLSPDQQHAAVVDDGPTPSIWILDFARGLRTRFTFQPRVASPVWSPDGMSIFYSAGPRLEAIFEKDAGGSRPETELLRVPASYLHPTSISPDGRFLLYYSTLKPPGPGVPGQTWVLALTKGARPVHLLGSQFSENRATFSPDGRWIAYRSNESGRFEVYIRSVVSSGSGGLSLGEGKWQVSRESVSSVLTMWRRDSKELFYITPQDVITAVSVDSSHGALQLGRPTPLFTAPCSCEFDVTADGQRFLVRGLAAANQAPLTVVLNWQAELKTR